MKIPLQPLIISAPFGNYIQPELSTATLGTFTNAARPPGTEENPARGGRLLRVLLTVRYNPFLRRWRNKIGLRNPGIDWLYDQWMVNAIHVSDKIVSIHGFNAEEWKNLLYVTSMMKPLAIEINASCPNVEDDEDPNIALDHLDVMITRVPVIVKLPPKGYMPIVEKAVSRGVMCFHACNTLPGPKGGFSGKPLKEHSLRAVKEIRYDFPDVQIIGGGGISKFRDMVEYWHAGADHVAVASCLFFPWNILKMKRLARQLHDMEASE